MKKNIAILGAGISGLSLAWFLKKQFQESVSITIFEAAARVGGWLHTIEKNGQLFECGPRSIRGTNPELLELIRDLDLEGEVLQASGLAKKRYIVHQGAIQPLPYSLGTLFSLPLGRKLIKAGLWELFSRPSKLDDESVESFFNRHIGKEATETFVSALTAGIYAAEPRELSMASCFPSLWERAQKSGSLLFSKRKKGPKATSFTFRDGLNTLPKRLASRLDAQILLNTKVIKVAEEAESVHLWTSQEKLSFDALFMAISPHHVREIAPCFQALRIPQSSVVTVSLGFKERLALPEGFGFLCPKGEDPLLLGVVFESCLFPEQNQSCKTRLSVMMRGLKADYSDAIEFCKKYLALSASVHEHHLVRAENAISCYPLGHHNLVRQLAERDGRIHLLGSGFHGVSVGDSVLSAKRIANHVYKKLLCF